MGNLCGKDDGKIVKIPISRWNDCKKWINKWMNGGLMCCWLANIYLWIICCLCDVHELSATRDANQQPASLAIPQKQQQSSTSITSAGLSSKRTVGQENVSQQQNGTSVFPSLEAEKAVVQQHRYVTSSGGKAYDINEQAEPGYAIHWYKTP